MSEDLKPLLIRIAQEIKGLREKVVAACATQGIQNNEVLIIASHVANLETLFTGLDDTTKRHEQRIALLDDLLTGAIERLSCVERQIFPESNLEVH